MHSLNVSDHGIVGACSPRHRLPCLSQISLGYLPPVVGNTQGVDHSIQHGRNVCQAKRIKENLQLYYVLYSDTIANARIRPRKSLEEGTGSFEIVLVSSLH